MGFKKKFEIGDKVQVIKPNDFRNNQIGEIKYYYYSSYNSKGVYGVSFENSTWNYYPNNLEKVEDSSNINTKSNKLSIFDLRPGMKVRIRPDLKEGQSTVVYVNHSMENYAGTIDTIKCMEYNISAQYKSIYLENTPYAWDIDCFSEIVEESKEEMNTSEKVEFPLKEGQVVTLLDGKKYQVIRNNTSEYTCSLCSLSKAKCGDNKCYISQINGNSACKYVIPRQHYFKLYKGQKPKNNSSKSLKISDFKEGMKVKVKKNFDEIPVSSNLCILSEMCSLKGKTFFIEHVYEKTIIIEGYHWLPEWLEIVDDSTNSSNYVENSFVKEVGIVTKVNFTLTDFKSEKLEHSKFTIL